MMMRFEQALQAMRDGKKIKRDVWSDGSYAFASDESGEMDARLVIRKHDCPFALSTTDIFAEDWEVVL